MQIRDILANNLRKQRKAAGLTQEKLAELSGLHRTYIGGIEQRRVNVSLKNIGRIADALEIDPALLFLSNPENDSATDSSAAWRMASAHAVDAQANMNLRKNAAAIAIWTDAGIDFKPLKTAYEDLTIRVLVDLVDKGYEGDELARRYQTISNEIIRFIER